MTAALGIDGGASIVKGQWSPIGNCRISLLSLPRPATDKPATTIRALSDAIRKQNSRFQEGSQHSLICFGGWGPLVAAALAEELETRELLIPDYAGCFDVLGSILQGNNYQAMKALDDQPLSMEVLHGVCRELMEEIAKQISLDGLDFDDVTCRQWVKVGRRGWNDNQFLLCNSRMSEHDITLANKGPGDSGQDRVDDLVMRQAVASARFDVTAVELPSPPSVTTRRTTVMPDDEIRRYLISGKVIERCELAQGARVDGPAAIREPWHLTVVPAGWRAEVAIAGGILLRRAGA
ncbi:MAG: hydantoinase/oxoprolinase family protein [Planctomycetota bacterium]